MTDYYPKVDVTPGEVMLEAKNIKQGRTLKVYLSRPEPVDHGVLPD